MTMFLYLLSIPAILILLHYLFNYNRAATLLRRIPGFKYTFLIGNILEVDKSPVDVFRLGRKTAKNNNGIYRFWSFPLGVINIYNPEDIEIILSSMKYHEKSSVYGFLKPWLQEGLLVSNGDKWQNRRKILTPAFHFNILRKYFVNFEENATQLVKELEKKLDIDVNIIPVISECTLNSICETAMGAKLNENSTGIYYKNAISELGTVLAQRFVQLHLYIDFIFNLSNLGKIQKRCLTIVHNFTKMVIKDRREDIRKNGSDIIDATNNNDDNNDVYKPIYSKKKKGAMLDLLFAAERDGLIDSKGIQEEVDTFMFEGHDTTASGLTYCLMLLANHPEIQDKIVMELLEIFGETKRATTVDDLHEMRYLERCIKESLRLYPAVPFISRNLNEDVILSNYLVPAGTQCHIHIYDLHRLENIYPNASKFDPDRFLPEEVAKRHNYAYIPFSAGPRNCIGQKFAMMEMKSIVSAILRNYQLLPVTVCEDLLFQTDIVLRNTKPVYVKFTKRHTVM